MAIEFESDNLNDKNLTPTKPATEQKVKPTKTKTPPLEKSIYVFEILAVISLIYAFTYSFSGVFILLPVALLWIFWFVLVVLASLFTVGIVWAIEGWRNFISGFMNFNKSLSKVSGSVTNFIYNILPYMAGLTSAIIITYLTLTIIYKVKCTDPKKHTTRKLVWAIIITVLFTLAIIWDILLFTNTAPNIFN